MTTVADLAAETRTYFLGGIREQRNKLASGGTTASSADTTLTFSYELSQITPGAVITIGVERMLVWAITASSKTAIVERGYDGSTVATHTVGDLVAINARVDDFAIIRAFNNELAALSSPARGLYRRRSIDLTYNPATFGYDMALSGTVIGQPIAVLTEQTGTGEWLPLPQGAWDYNSSADATDFPSGRSITIGPYGSTGLKVRVVYRAPFVALTALSQDVNAISFLPSTANDILPLGAALQLGSARPMQRTDMNAQGSTRRNEETSTQDTLIGVAGLRARYEQRILDEATRFVADDPVAI